MLELICKNLRRRSQLAIQAVELVADLLTKKSSHHKLLRSCAQLVYNSSFLRT